MQSAEGNLTAEAQPAPLFSGRTAWARNLETPLRSFLRTETGSAAVLLAATVAALVWVNLDSSSYERTWSTVLSIRLGGAGVTEDLRYWLNSGLMTFFFFVVGLEARREFDMGELRERRRLALPLAAGFGGIVVPVAIFLSLNAGRSSAHGWGAAMSTDTAFALGMLALVGRRLPDRLRAFMLTFAVVDDVVALIVIATVYSDHVALWPLFVALGLFVDGQGSSARFSFAGANVGYKCRMLGYMNSGQGVVVMTNSENGAELIAEIIRSVAAEYGWPDFHPRARVIIKLDPRIYDSYVGEYEIAPGFVLVVTREGDKLMSQAMPVPLPPSAVGQPKSEMFPESETTFFVKDADAQFTFIKNDQGQVIQVNIQRTTRLYQARKIK